MYSRLRPAFPWTIKLFEACFFGACFSVTTQFGIICYRSVSRLEFFLAFQAGTVNLLVIRFLFLMHELNYMQHCFSKCRFVNFHCVCVSHVFVHLVVAAICGFIWLMPSSCFFVAAQIAIRM